MVTSKVTKTTTTELGVDIKAKDIVAMVEPTVVAMFGAKHPHIEVSVVWNTENAGSEVEPEDVIIHVRAILVVNE